MSRASEPVFYGMVIAGGASKRMGRDKALTEYHGRPQWEYCAGLLKEFCATVYISKNTGQRWEPSANFETLTDKQADQGPFHPWSHLYTLQTEAYWILMTCDLPFANRDCIQFLVGKFQTEPESTDALCLRAEDQDFPDPQIALLSPSGTLAAQAAYNAGERSPRRFLKSINTQAYAPKDPAWLYSANTPEAVKSAQAILSEL